MSKLSSAQYTFNNLFPVTFGIKNFFNSALRNRFCAASPSENRFSAWLTSHSTGEYNRDE